jgi:hypothetical protein
MREKCKNRKGEQHNLKKESCEYLGFIESKQGTRTIIENVEEKKS